MRDHSILLYIGIVLISAVAYLLADSNETLSCDNAKLTKDNKELLRAINSMNSDVEQMVADGKNRETAERLKADGCLLVLDYN